MKSKGPKWAEKLAVATRKDASALFDFARNIDPKMVPKISSGNLMKTIFGLCAEKIEADRVNDSQNIPRRRMEDFLGDFFLNKFGLLTIAQRNLAQFLVALKLRSAGVERPTTSDNKVTMLNESETKTQGDSTSASGNNVNCLVFILARLCRMIKPYYEEQKMAGDFFLHCWKILTPHFNITSAMMSHEGDVCHIPVMRLDACAKLIFRSSTDIGVDLTVQQKMIMKVKLKSLEKATEFTNEQGSRLVLLDDLMLLFMDTWEQSRDSMRDSFDALFFAGNTHGLVLLAVLLPPLYRSAGFPLIPAPAYTPMPLTPLPSAVFSSLSVFSVSLNSDGIISTEEFYHLLLYLDSEFEKPKALQLYSEVMNQSEAERKESEKTTNALGGRFSIMHGEDEDQAHIHWAPDSMLVSSFTNVLMNHKLDPTRAKEAIERQETVLGDDTDDDYSDTSSMSRSRRVSLNIDNRRGSVSDVASRYVPPTLDDGCGMEYSHKLRTVWKEVEGNLIRDTRNFPPEVKDEIDHRIQHLQELMDQADALTHGLENGTDTLMLNAGWVALDMLEK